MNISESPISYNTLTEAYSVIRNQYHYDYVCQVKDIIIDDKEVYYDVGMIVGYLRSLNKDKLAEKIYDKYMED